MQSSSPIQEGSIKQAERQQTDNPQTTVAPAVTSEQPAVRKSLPGVRIKYELFPFHKEVIKTLSVCGNMLVFGSGNENDLVKVVMFSASDTSIDYRQVQLHKVMNTRQNFIEWSPNGRYLALGWEKVTIWQYEGGVFRRFKEHPDVLFEVTAFTWCPNSEKYAAAGINTSLSIFVRSIDSDEKIKELKNQYKVLGLVWDPFDKHLASLLSNNEVVVYKCAGWQRSHTINLNLDPQKPLKYYVAKREDRKIDWSPDFRYLLVPALDDRTIPLVVALNRNKNFTTRCIFIGPFSCINCVKFSPVMYLLGNQPISIFAMGDNDGSISLWGIGQKFYSRQPFYLFKSHKDENELIEDIEWSDDGKIIFASTFKRYLVTILVEEGNFGKRLSDEEKRTHLQNLYGSLRSFTSTQNEFKIYKHGEVRSEREIFAVTQPKKMLVEENKISQQPPQEFVFTQQKTLSVGGKKKIIPGMLVKKDEVETTKNRIQEMMNGAAAQQQQAQNTVAKPSPSAAGSQDKPKPNPETRPVEQKPATQSSESAQPAPKAQFKVTVEQKLMLPMLDTSPSTYLIDGSHSVEIEYKPAPANESTLRVYIIEKNQREMLSSIAISGRVNHLCVHNSQLLIYSSEGYFYSFGTWGQATELPLFLGRIHLFKVNNNGDILTISLTCDVKIFNVTLNKLFLLTNIFELVAANIEDKESRQVSKVIDAVELGDDRSIAIQFTNKKVFLWNQEAAAWSLVDSSLYELDRAASPSAPTGKTATSTKEEQVNRQFMETLLSPPNLTPVHKLEYHLVFYRKHRPNKSSYCHALLEYVKELAKQRMDNRLRVVLQGHFLDSSREEFLNEPPKALLEQLFAIESSIIEEFRRLYGSMLN